MDFIINKNTALLAREMKLDIFSEKESFTNEQFDCLWKLISPNQNTFHKYLRDNYGIMIEVTGSNNKFGFKICEFCNPYYSLIIQEQFNEETSDFDMYETCLNEGLYQAIFYIYCKYTH